MIVNLGKNYLGKTVVAALGATTTWCFTENADRQQLSASLFALDRNFGKSSTQENVRYFWPIVYRIRIMAVLLKKRKLNVILVVLLPLSSWMLKLSIRNLKAPTFLVHRLCLAAKAESLGRWCPYLSQFYPCSARLSFCPSASRYHNHNQIVLQGMRKPNR